ncbi:MAG: homoserine dehydrogenase [Actinobacteria bacterium]|nr:homoserine dehydrogenase [Actinomycetota bacterium]
MRERHGLRVLVTAAGTRRGCLVDPAGLTPAEVLARAGHGPALPQAPLPARDLLAASDADVLVELTVMGDLSAATNAVPYRPEATAHVLEAFRLGMDVVTANKGPIAWSWPEVSQAAAAAGRRIRCESAVVDGLPVFSLLEFALPDCRVLGFEAVFNATTNFIVDAMGAGRSFEDALAQTQADGYAEADPRNDVDGWDAASKAAALANVAMDAGITPADVERLSLRDVPLERITRAREAGRRLRLVTSVWREPAGPTGPAGEAGPAGPVRACLRAEELDVDHPLAAVGGESLAVLLHTDLMGDILVCERHALLPQTAYGVYADLMHLCRTG